MHRFISFFFFFISFIIFFVFSGSFHAMSRGGYVFFFFLGYRGFFCFFFRGVGGGEGFFYLVANINKKYKSFDFNLTSLRIIIGPVHDLVYRY